MDQKQIDSFTQNGILVTTSVKEKQITDIDKLIKQMKERNIFILDSKTLHDILGFESDGDFKISPLKDYNGDKSISTPQAWVEYFNDRFEQLKNLLITRLNGNVRAISISNIRNVPQGDEVELIGMISDISISPVKKYTIITLEDRSGTCKVISKTIDEELVKDQVIFVRGKKINDAVFIDEINLPDISIKEETQNQADDVYAIFLSDIHTGSSLFAERQLDRLVSWLNGSIEDFSDIAKKVKIIVLNGDLVDGIGVYPEQEGELSIKNVIEQYNSLYEILNRIPDDKKLIITPGNHDAIHIAEPQPHVDPYFAGKLYNLENAMFLSNPSSFNVIYDGIKRNILLYHGFGLMYYVNTIPKYNKMRNEDIASIMTLQLKSRHLAPTHGSTQLMPLKHDYLVIDEVPDIYATGHVHNAFISKYKSTVMINSSCWQFQTKYQKKYGIIPQVAKLPVVNLKNKRTIMLDFLNEKIGVLEGNAV
ncbi:MAG: metallophosphoesterase [Candidatus Parvarchaeota archaeon]|nr:metallophosphoesterase [Candidatus Parvarchaeota archaeon]